MKAAILTGVSTFELRDFPEPACPDDGLVLQIKACGVCGSDIRRWKEGPGSTLVVAGHEIAGVVNEVGSAVQGYSIGDYLAVAPDIHCGNCHFCRKGMYNLCDNLRLIGITPGYPGGFSEKMVLTGEILTNGIVHKFPTGLSFEQAALAEPCSSVLASHDKAGTDLEHTVLVLGGGPIGCLHIVVAQLRGAKVILSEPNPVRRKIAERFNPFEIIDPSKDNFINYVHEKTDQIGADIVVCANPIASTQTQAIEMVRKGGRVILFGGLPKDGPMTSLDANRIHYGEITVVGSFSYHPIYHEIALNVISRGVIPDEELITHHYGITEVNQAFQTAASGEALKVIISF
jgi:L-iditol 2-dehydrogenase